MLDKQRHLFDMPETVHYLNCAYMSPLLKSAIDAGHQAVSAKGRPWLSSIPDFFTGSQQARELFAGLINAAAADIAIVPSVSYGTAIAALNLELGEGDGVLVLEDEFPSNIYAWRVKAAAQNARIVTVKRPADNDWTTAIIQVLQTENISIAVLSQTHWIDGGQIDLQRVSAERARGDFALVVDLTQSLGVMAADVQAVEPDFLICASYKWLLGPYSLGFVYVHPRHQAGVPLEQGWINRPGAEDFSRLIDYVDELNPDASRFDMGERSNFQLLPIAIEGMKQIHRWGQQNIVDHLGDYTRRLRSDLEALGFESCDERFRSPHYLSVQHPELPEDVLAILAEKQIFLSKRGDSLRISPHLYNNDNDAAQLVQALKSLLRS